MRTGSRTRATFKMKFFVAIIKKWKLLNTVARAPSYMLQWIQKSRKYKCQVSCYDLWKLP